jgi:hypothetical protein
MNKVIEFVKTHPKKTLSAVAAVAALAGAPEGAIIKVGTMLLNLFL